MSWEIRMVNDPYAVLGIGRDATSEEIKKAYRTQAKKYHPDLHPNDPAAAEKMNEVNEAYDMLTNPQKYARQRGYNSSGAGGAGNYGYGGQSGYGTGSNSGSSQNGQWYYRQYGNGSSQSGQNGQSGYGGGQSGPGGWSSDFWGFDFSDLFGFGGYQTMDTKPKPENGDSVELVRAITYVNSGKYAEAVMTLSKMVSGLRNARWYYVSAVAYNGAGDYERALDMISKAIKLDPYNKVYSTLYRQYQMSEQSRYNNVEYRTYSPFGSYSSDNSPFGRRSPFGIFGKLILWFFIIQFIMGFLRLLFFGFFL